MLPTELRLLSLGDCYIRLPRNFASREKDKIKPGSAICIKSVQNDTELLVQWNGNLSSEDSPQLDFQFGRANGFADKELILLSHEDNWNPSECAECRVELLKPQEYSILSQHSEANLLDSCKLVYKGLVIPIKVSQYVQVLVKVVGLSPDYPGSSSILTKWTEMHFQHNLSGDPPKDISDSNDEQDKEFPILNPYSYVSKALGIETSGDPSYGAMLICGEKGSGKKHLLKSIIHDYRRYYSQYLDCKQFKGKRIKNIKKTFDDLIVNAIQNQPSILALNGIGRLVGVPETINDINKGQEALYRRRLVDVFCYLFKKLVETDASGRVALLMSCRSFEALDKEFSRSKSGTYFSEILKIGKLNLEERKSILRNLMSEEKLSRCNLDDKQLEQLARKCNSFMAQDLKLLVARATSLASSRSLQEFTSEPLALEAEDLDQALEGFKPLALRDTSLRERTSVSLGDVGGMKAAKTALRRNLLMQLKYPRLFARCPVRAQTSVLLYGPSGCGKSFFAEALTNEDGINSIYVKGPELLNKYIGSSEQKVRDIFERAKLAKPCVIFFDEFESLVPKRGGDTTGVTYRIVNQFLTMMDGVDGLGEQVFLLAATSRRDLIDPAILRPGRMDQHIECPAPDASDRLEILSIKSRDFALDESCDLERWSVKLDKFTGADIKSLLYSAQLSCFKEQLDRLKSDADLGQLAKVSERHLEAAYEEMAAKVEASRGQAKAWAKPEVGVRATLS